MVPVPSMMSFHCALWLLQVEQSKGNSRGRELRQSTPALPTVAVRVFFSDQNLISRVIMTIIHSDRVPATDCPNLIRAVAAGVEADLQQIRVSKLRSLARCKS